MEDLGKKVKVLEKKNIAFKRKEKKLKESIELYRLLLEDITDIISRHSSDGTIIYVSPAVYTILGYEPSELIGANGFDPFIYPDDLPKVQSKIMEVLEKGHIYDRIEHRMLRKDGDYVWVESTGRLSPTANEKKSFEIISVTREITERKQLEEYLKKSRAELEEKVTERTRKLKKNNQELATKTKELKDVNAALNVLLKNREEDNIKLKESILSNVKYFIDPHIQKLKNNNLNENQKSIVSIVEKNLNEIVSPMAKELLAAYSNLTPREIQIANLIKIGKSTKEIADLEGLSARTIEFHRDNLRKKLGLKNKKINLRTHLLSLP
jgi:PAS domain S-box-containing protein